MPLTKQLRINNADEIRRRISEFAGKKINVVLADNRVIIGELNEITPDGIYLKNMRLKKVFFTFSELSEIYFDTIVN